MKKYEKYKSSEIDGIAIIPNGWDVRRIKDQGEYQSGNFISALDFDEENEYPVYGGNGLRGYSKNYNHNGPYILIGRQGALCGNINYASGKFWATEHAVVVYAKQTVNIKWFGELLKALNLNQYSLSAAQPGLSVDKIKRLLIPVPPLSEQTAIASYLDAKTSAIDRKVSLLEQKIIHYQQLRKSLINETVCRGLDKNVTLKESGIEWIGLIPEHWENLRLKDIGYLYSGLSGKSGNDFNQEENPDNKQFIPFTNIFNNHIINPLQLGAVVVGSTESQNNVKANDLFFLMSSEDYDGLGKTSLLDQELKETYLNSFCKGFRITKNYISPYFLNYQLNSFVYRNILKIEGKGFTRMNLKMEKVSDLQIFFPDSIAEQNAIATFLDEKTQKIDLIITNITNQISTLKELRKTLINDVVTGKLKVTTDV